MSQPFVPFIGLDRQYSNLKAEILDATDRVLRSGIYINGQYTKKFEDWLAKKTGCQYATVVHSGTAALEFISRFYHDHFIYTEKPIIRVPNLTYIATLNAFLNTGWQVELVDTDKNGIMKLERTDSSTFNCSIGLFGTCPGKATSGTITDGAQHWLVAEPDTIGDAMAISFDPTKNLPSSGNGGAIVTKDRALYDYVSSFKNNGKPNNFFTGTNNKMSELECAHMIVRANYIDSWQDKRKLIRDYYIDELKNYPIRCLSKGITTHANHKFVVDVDDRNTLDIYLRQNGIETKIHYPHTIAEHPVARSIKVKPDLLGISYSLSRRILSLPIYPEMYDYEVELVVDKIKKFYC
jgi:dTDP-4-amino-4,6-dideoxygalactose transaminase